MLIKQSSEYKEALGRAISEINNIDDLVDENDLSDQTTDELIGYYLGPLCYEAGIYTTQTDVFDHGYFRCGGISTALTEIDSASLEAQLIAFAPLLDADTHDADTFCFIALTNTGDYKMLYYYSNKGRPTLSLNLGKDDVAALQNKLKPYE